MKVKNFKSIIHNFSDSLQSIDFRISDKLIFDEILLLHDEYGINTVEFDFIKRTIIPSLATNANTQNILDDYANWLPELIESQNCEAEYLNSLLISVSVDFEKLRQPVNMSDTVEVTINTTAKYQIREREEKTINLTLTELYLKRNFPKNLRRKYSILKL